MTTPNKTTPHDGLQRPHTGLSITAAFADDEDDDEPCERCGEHHPPEQTAECPYGGCEPGEHCPHDCPYESGHTNWDDVYPHLSDTMHRGAAIHLPGHDPDAPHHEIAHDILDHLGEHGLGTHWSNHESQARHYAAVSHRSGHHNLHVIVHAAKAARDDIEEDPHELLRQDVIGFDQHPDAEIPLQHRVPVDITGVSWKAPAAREWTRHNLTRPVQHRAVRRTAGGKPWLPHDRFFGPGHPDLDPRLFSGTNLKSPWRRALLGLVNRAFADFTYRVPGGWQRWARAYLAGSQASHWYGNNDLDVLVGIDYDAFRRAQPRYRMMSDRDIDEMLNARAHEVCDPARWFTIDGERFGPFDSTVYVNPDSYDIRKIKPYAAYDLRSARWAVKPVQVPDDFGPDSLPSEDFLYARSLASQVRALRKLPAGQAQTLGAALYDKLHSERHDAFSDHGGGLYDVRNIAWKYLTQHPEKPMERLVAWKRAEQAGPGLRSTSVYERPALENPSAAQFNDQLEVAWRRQHDPDYSPPDRHEWFHGTTGMFDHPEVSEAGEKDRVGQHWNTGLGTHWAASHSIADGFAGAGIRDKVDHSRVFHARLHIANPRRYTSEFDMDKEAYAHEYDAGNLPQHHPAYQERWAQDPHLGHTRDLRPNSEGTEQMGGYRFARWLSTHPDREGVARRFKQRLIDAGHDGIVYGNEIERTGMAGEWGHNNDVSAIAFHPRQVEITQVHRGGDEHHQHLDDVRHPRPGQPALPGMGPGLEHLAGMSGPGSDASFKKNSVMIALVPPRSLAEKLTVDKGEPADQMHVTLAYIPHVEPAMLGRLTGTVAEWASRQRPITARVQGLGTFVNDGEHPLWAAVDIPGSSHLHSSLVDALDRAGFPPSKEHGFCPHMTLSYNKYHVRFLPKKIVPESFTCHSVYVCRGDNWRPVPLSGATAGKVQ